MKKDSDLVTYSLDNVPLPPSAGRAHLMSEAELTAAALSDPDTIMLDENFAKTGLRYFSLDGQRRFVITPENSVLEVDHENRILGIMSKFPQHVIFY